LQEACKISKAASDFSRPILIPSPHSVHPLTSAGIGLLWNFKMKCVQSLSPKWLFKGLYFALCMFLGVHAKICGVWSTNIPLTPITQEQFSTSAPLV
jgi:hypothetical protein